METLELEAKEYLGWRSITGAYSRSYKIDENSVKIESLQGIFYPNLLKYFKMWIFFANQEQDDQYCKTIYDTCKMISARREISDYRLDVSAPVGAPGTAHQDMNRFSPTAR